MYEREIVYDPKSKDFILYLNGQLVGFARTYQEGQAILDQLVYDLLQSESAREAA